MLKLFFQIPLLRRLYFDRLGWAWIRRKVKPFMNFLENGEKIVDIGSGNGLICFHLRQEGFDVTPLDVVDMPFDKSVQPIVYDGKIMPFEDKAFDTAIILTVLHHTDEPEMIIKEAKRIAKRIIIIEDIYKNPIQKYATFAMDWLVNLGYSYNPHTNKEDKGWRNTFQEMDLKLIHTTQWRVLLFFRQVLYILKTVDF
jgi:ubiquinone/menaquinone biosynthesis C-methylase UbiE